MALTAKWSVLGSVLGAGAIWWAKWWSKWWAGWFGPWSLPLRVDQGGHHEHGVDSPHAGPNLCRHGCVDHVTPPLPGHHRQ